MLYETRHWFITSAKLLRTLLGMSTHKMETKIGSYNYLEIICKASWRNVPHQCGKEMMGNIVYELRFFFRG